MSGYVSWVPRNLRFPSEFCPGWKHWCALWWHSDCQWTLDRCCKNPLTARWHLWVSGLLLTLQVGLANPRFPKHQFLNVIWVALLGPGAHRTQPCACPNSVEEKGLLRCIYCDKQRYKGLSPVWEAALPLTLGKHLVHLAQGQFNFCLKENPQSRQAISSAAVWRRRRRRRMENEGQPPGWSQHGCQILG